MGDAHKTGNVKEQVDQTRQLALAALGGTSILTAAAFLHHPVWGGFSYVALASTTLIVFGFTGLNRFAVRGYGAQNAHTKKIVRAVASPPQLHWKHELKIRTCPTLQGVPRGEVWSEDLVQQLQRMSLVVNTGQGHRYVPPIYAEEFTHIQRWFSPISSNVTAKDPLLTIDYQAVSPLWFRASHIMENAQEMMSQMGLSGHDLDDVKEFLGKQRLWVLGVTYAISMLHMFFDFLAFKNDIGFYRGRTNFIGISSRSITSKFICSLVIYLYLMDNEYTSNLILGSVGVSTLIELWKVKQVLQIRVVWKPTFWIASGADELDRKYSTLSKTTHDLDEMALRNVGYCLYPLIVGISVYTLVYGTQKSWWSWVISSLANGVYTFGFVMMTPQLFINYRLKSVAHLPWRVFMYKAFNTFIDDVFAFIISMPIAHRVACLRDDLVFVIFLYQMYLYPVDLKRVNEYGIAYEEDTPETGGNQDAPLGIEGSVEAAGIENAIRMEKEMNEVALPTEEGVQPTELVKLEKKTQ